MTAAQFLRCGHSCKRQKHGHNLNGISLPRPAQGQACPLWKQTVFRSGRPENQLCKDHRICPDRYDRTAVFVGLDAHLLINVVIDNGKKVRFQHVRARKIACDHIAVVHRYGTKGHVTAVKFAHSRGSTTHISDIHDSLFSRRTIFLEPVADIDPLVAHDRIAKCATFFIGDRAVKSLICIGQQGRLSALAMS